MRAGEIGRSVLCNLADGKRIASARKYNVRLLTGEDPGLPPLAVERSLLDFFRCRFDVVVREHLLQSTALALERIGWGNARYWMGLQTACELARERRRQAA